MSMQDMIILIYTESSETPLLSKLNFLLERWFLLSIYNVISNTLQEI